MAFNYITAEEAAEMIKNGDSIGTSGFTAPGSPKFISRLWLQKPRGNMPQATNSR